MVVTKLTLVCASAPGPLELDLTGELGGNARSTAGKVGASLCQKGWQQSTVLGPAGSVPGAQQQLQDTWVLSRGVRGQVGQADSSSLHGDVHGSFKMVTALEQTSAKKQLGVNCRAVLAVSCCRALLAWLRQQRGLCSSCPSCSAPEIHPEHSTKEL